MPATNAEYRLEQLVYQYQAGRYGHSSRHGSSQEFPSLVHSICTSSAPALEMHSAQVLEMLAQMECSRSVQVLQEMLCIQECVQECVT